MNIPKDRCEYVRHSTRLKDEESDLSVTQSRVRRISNQMRGLSGSEQSQQMVKYSD